MSVLIKGMEMPVGCFECIMTDRLFNGSEIWLCCNVLQRAVSDDGEKPDDCPLVLVPPHGRLIDADKYEFPGDLKDEPTIIPAEEG